jgi:lipoprotein-anchoring transpeptidase ErfK/SrfK
MYGRVIVALAASAISVSSAKAEPLPLSPQWYDSSARRQSVPAYIGPSREIGVTPDERIPPARTATRRSRQDNMGGGFIEFLFNGEVVAPPRPPAAVMARTEPHSSAAELTTDPSRTVDPKFDRQLVEYRGPEIPGTIIIDTPQRFLYLVQENGKALRYGIGVGKPGFTWAGAKKITAKKEWPDWVPPPEMLERRPDLPHFMAGGPENPLGARALYLGSSLYRIHGSNEPWTIGQAVSSGCIRMRNDDVIDLYDRVKTGTKVIVI